MPSEEAFAAVTARLPPTRRLPPLMDTSRPLKSAVCPTLSTANKGSADDKPALAERQISKDPSRVELGFGSSHAPRTMRIGFPQRYIPPSIPQSVDSEKGLYRAIPPLKEPNSIEVLLPIGHGVRKFVFAILIPSGNSVGAPFAPWEVSRAKRMHWKWIGRFIFCHLVCFTHLPSIKNSTHMLITPSPCIAGSKSTFFWCMSEIGYLCPILLL